MMPKWIAILYSLIFVLALLRCFKSKGHIIKIIAFPLIFAGLAWWNFNLASKMYKHGLWLWAVGGVTGFVEGLISTKKLGLRADKKKWRIELPGSILMLVLSTLLFCLENLIYFFESAAIPLLNAKVFIMATILVSGWVAGMVMGRHLNYLKKYAKAGHTDLV